jgi:hypothetical protein
MIKGNGQAQQTAVAYGTGIGDGHRLDGGKPRRFPMYDGPGRAVDLRLGGCQTITNYQS